MPHVSISLSPQFPTLRLGDLLVFSYCNYRNERSLRRVTVMEIWYGESQWHKGPQWFLKARDEGKGEDRDFAMRDMSDIRWDRV